MKKLFAVIVSACMLAFPLVSCGDSQEEVPVESDSPSRPVRVSGSTIDPEIIGTWMNDTSGYRFQEDRKVTLIMDFSGVLHFNSDGSLSIPDGTVPPENIEYDGSTLKAVYISDEYTDDDGNPKQFEVFTLERKDSPNADDINGEYKMTGGVYLDIISGGIGIEAEKADVQIDVDGEKFDVTVLDYCFYETLEDSLQMFSENMHYINENANSVNYTYVIEDDVLTLTYDDTGDKEILKKVE